MQKLRVETKKISEITPADYNPRLDIREVPAYEKLKKSIEQFGLVEPIVFNERTGRIVGGHQRFTIVKELGWDEVEVSVIDVSETEEKILNIALNKIDGEWDMPKLKDVLLELDTGEFEMDLTGFDEDEIEQLMTQYNVEDLGMEEETSESFDEIDEDIDTEYVCPSCKYSWSGSPK